MVRTEATDRRDALAEVLGIDLRSLAAFRIGAATLLLLDLWFRAQEATSFFTDVGVLPRQARIIWYDLSDQFGFRHQWSLHMGAGTYWWQGALLLLAGLFAFWMLIGYRTRLASWASWFLLLSLDARNPVILDSGDVLFRTMLFWSLFLPLGAVAGVDARRSGQTQPRRVVSAATVAMLAQLCMMYLFSVGFKAQSLGDEPSPWTAEGGFSAVYYALNVDEFVTPAGVWLRQFPVAMRWLTIATLALEVVGPILVFSPWWTRRLRVATVIAFWLFHLALAVTLDLALFPPICMVSWFVFLPGEFWEWVARARDNTAWARGGWAWYRELLAVRRPRWFSRPETPDLRRRWCVEALVTGLLVYVLLWNVRELDFRRLEPYVLPREANVVARVLGLDQNWSMFAPKPRTQDGWLVMRGVLRDGSEVNLWDPGQPLPIEKPARVHRLFRSQRWRKYLDNLTTEAYGPHRQYFCDWLAWRWNREQARGNATREVVEVELRHRIEVTPPPGAPFPPIETLILFTWYYE